MLTCITPEALAADDKKTRMTLLTKAIELDPNLARAYYNRGVLYMDEGTLPQARADFEKAIELNENFIFAHYNLACVYSLESRPDEALASLETALLKGYQKFDKISDDPDLKNLADKPAFAALIAKYRARAATTKLMLYSDSKFPTLMSAESCSRRRSVIRMRRRRN